MFEHFTVVAELLRWWQPEGNDKRAANSLLFILQEIFFVSRLSWRTPVVRTIPYVPYGLETCTMVADRDNKDLNWTFEYSFIFQSFFHFFSFFFDFIFISFFNSFFIFCFLFFIFIFYFYFLFSIFYLYFSFSIFYFSFFIFLFFIFYFSFFIFYFSCSIFFFIFISFRKIKFVAPQEDIKNFILHCHKGTIRTHAYNDTETHTKTLTHWHIQTFMNSHTFPHATRGQEEDIPHCEKPMVGCVCEYVYVCVNSK